MFRECAKCAAIGAVACACGLGAEIAESVMKSESKVQLYLAVDQEDDENREPTAPKRSGLVTIQASSTASFSAASPGEWAAIPASGAPPLQLSFWRGAEIPDIDNTGRRPWPPINLSST
jgi:hypothetical protein